MSSSALERCPRGHADPQGFFAPAGFPRCSSCNRTTEEGTPFMRCVQPGCDWRECLACVVLRAVVGGSGGGGGAGAEDGGGGGGGGEATPRTPDGLCVGTRVAKGADWAYGNEDRGGLGTVVALNPQATKHSVKVRWDTGYENQYRAGREGKFDLRRVADLPELGTRVERGPHWRWEDQDKGSKGTVVRSGQAPSQMIRILP